MMLRTAMSATSVRRPTQIPVARRTKEKIATVTLEKVIAVIQPVGSPVFGFIGFNCAGLFNMIALQCEKSIS